MSFLNPGWLTSLGNRVIGADLRPLIGPEAKQLSEMYGVGKVAPFLLLFFLVLFLYLVQRVVYRLGALVPGRPVTRNPYYVARMYFPSRVARLYAAVPQSSNLLEALQTLERRYLPDFWNELRVSRDTSHSYLRIVEVKAYVLISFGIVAAAWSSGNGSEARIAVREGVVLAVLLAWGCYHVLRWVYATEQQSLTLFLALEDKLAVSEGEPDPQVLNDCADRMEEEFQHQQSEEAPWWGWEWWGHAHTLHWTARTIRQLFGHRRHLLALRSRGDDGQAA